MGIRKLLKGVGYIVVAIPLLLVAQCVYIDASQKNGLESLCDTAKVGAEINVFLGEATKTSYKVRTGGTAGKDENEWFDREYLRLGVWLKKNKHLADDYTVVFAKPGIGYYACIVVFRDTLITNSWFEDRSS